MRSLIVPLGVAVSTALLLAGCAAPTAPTSPASGAATTPASSSSVASAATSAAAPTTPTTPAAAPNPALPTLDGAIPVGTVYSSFAIPSGAISCATDGTVAQCTFPDGMKAGVPTAYKVCGTTRRFVVGVTVSTDKAKYMCLSSPSPFPAKGSSQVAWHSGTSFGWVEHEDASLAVLPAGKKISSGDLVCESQAESASCGNVVTGHGFKLSIDGPEFF